jgi:hypothetical protein
MLHFDQRDHPQAPRLPWLGTCADETKRSKNPDYSTVGSLDSNAAGRPGRPYRKRLAEILPRTSGYRVAAIGFPGPRAGQMANHSRLAAGCRAIVRLLDIACAPDRAGPQAATGPAQVQELRRRGRVTVIARSLALGHQRVDRKHLFVVGPGVADRPARLARERGEALETVFIARLGVDAFAGTE